MNVLRLSDLHAPAAFALVLTVVAGRIVNEKLH
jgi:hypothetical protein